MSSAVTSFTVVLPVAVKSEVVTPCIATTFVRFVVFTVRLSISALVAFKVVVSTSPMFALVPCKSVISALPIVAVLEVIPLVLIPVVCKLPIAAVSASILSVSTFSDVISSILALLAVTFSVFTDV